MKNIKFLSFFLSLCLIFGVAAATLAVPVSAVPAEFDAVEEDVPEGNVLYMSDFDSAGAMIGVSASARQISQVRTDTGSYLQMQYITTNYIGLKLVHPDGPIPAGEYYFTGYFRMIHVGEVTGLRIIFHSENGEIVIGTTSSGAEVKKFTVYPTSDEWMKVEGYVNLTDDLTDISVCGETDPMYVQPYCIDNFSLVPAAIPDGYVIQNKWGKSVSGSTAYASQVDSKFSWPKWYEEYEAQYDVQGVIVNQDADSLISSVPGTIEGIKNLAYGYAGSHVTDFMICVNNMNSTFQTDLENWTDLVDKYYQTEENGVAVDYTTDSRAKGAYNHYVVNKEKLGGRDYFDILCEAFTEVGINPWISFRMNDLHGQGETASLLLSDFYHNNPQLRRVQENRRSYAAGNSYYDSALDWTHEIVRERFLAYINEALSRYDCYGIELDFQREIWLWHPGGEYNGIELLNDFMREVDALTELYAAKYGHEIKVCVRLASDIETNYEFGLDVLTWAAEDLIDMVIPTGRWGTTDTDIPVTLWTSYMHPYGVTVAPCIEIRIQNPGTNFVGDHTFETYNGIAASFLSQGADKIALFNQYIGFAGINYIHKISSEDEIISGTYRHWVIVSTIGSYEKLMTRNRRVVLTYNDTYNIWDTKNAQLQKWGEAGETVTLRFPLGDVPLGATATVKFSVNTPNDVNPPVVYINSARVELANIEYNEEGYTTKPILCYKVPESALDDMFAVVEITSTHTLRIDYAEARIDVAD